MEIFGVVSKVYTGDKAGYYDVQCSTRSDTLTGVSITSEPLGLGERVNVVQCMFIGSGDKYGFFKSNYEHSVIQIGRESIEAIKHLYPYSYLLADIAYKAYNRKSMYGSGVIRSLIASGTTVVGARVDLMLSGTQASLGFADTLNTDKFKVDDGVLVRYYPYEGRLIMGWWDTVPKLDYNDTLRWLLWKDGSDTYLTKSFVTTSGQISDIETIPLILPDLNRSVVLTTRHPTDDNTLYLADNNGDIYNINIFNQNWFRSSTYVTDGLTSLSPTKVLYRKTSDISMYDIDGSNYVDVKAYLTSLGISVSANNDEEAFNLWETGGQTLLSWGGHYNGSMVVYIVNMDNGANTYISYGGSSTNAGAFIWKDVDTGVHKFNIRIPNYPNVPYTRLYDFNPETLDYTYLGQIEQGEYPKIPRGIDYLANGRLYETYKQDDDHASKLHFLTTDFWGYNPFPSAYNSQRDIIASWIVRGHEYQWNT